LLSPRLALAESEIALSESKMAEMAVMMERAKEEQKAMNKQHQGELKREREVGTEEGEEGGNRRRGGRRSGRWEQERGWKMKREHIRKRGRWEVKREREVGLENDRVLGKEEGEGGGNKRKIGRWEL